MSKAGQVYWITGLSGSGKSTLGTALHARLERMGKTAVLLDGDAVRELVLENTDYSREARLKIAQFNGRLCRLLSSQGVDVVCPTISLFHSCQQWNRANIANYYEVFLDVSLDYIRGHDPKGVYAGNKVNVVGVDIPAELPQAADLIFHAPPYRDVEAMVDEILKSARAAAAAKA